MYNGPDDFNLPGGEMTPRTRRMATLRGQTAAAAADAQAPFGPDPFIGMMPRHAQDIAHQDGQAAVRRQMEQSDADIREQHARDEAEKKKREGESNGMVFGLGYLAYRNAESDLHAGNPAPMQQLQANFKRGVDAHKTPGHDAAHKGAGPHPHAQPAAAHTAHTGHAPHLVDRASLRSVGANTAIDAGFVAAESYILKRAESALLGGVGSNQSRALAAEAAGGAMVGAVGGAVAQGAMFLIPGYTSYHEFQQGNIMSGIIWGAVDVVGLAGCAFSFGASGAAVSAAKTAKFGIKAAEALEATAKGVQASGALERAGAAVGKTAMVYKTGEQAYYGKQFYDFTQTDEGKALTAALHAEFLGSGASKEQLLDYVKAKMPHGADNKYAEIQAQEVKSLIDAAPAPNGAPKPEAETRVADAKPAETPLPNGPVHGNHKVATPVQAPKFGVDLTLASGPKPPTSEVLG